MTQVTQAKVTLRSHDGICALQVDKYTEPAMVDPEAFASAARFVQREWGDVGYRIGFEARDGGLYVFRCAHSDGSRFWVWADKYGNVGQLVDDYYGEQAAR